MPMNEQDIVAMIQAAMPDARVEMQDLRGDGDHYHATVISATFQGLTRIQQHQKVYAALQGRMGGELHALSLTTKIS